MVEFAEIAGVGLAMSLAYLKLDRFRHRRSIEDCARSELKRLGDDKGMLEDYKDREYYKILRRLAGEDVEKKRSDMEQGEDEESRTSGVRGPWFQIYRLLFLRRVDRCVSYFMMFLLLATLLASSGGFLANGKPWLETLLWIIISFAIFFSIYLVLYGDRMVRLAMQEIHHSGYELEQYMALPARDIDVDIP